MSLFQRKDFIMRSGRLGRIKVEFDHMTADDIAAIAYQIAEEVKFSRVVGVPRTDPTKEGVDNGKRLQEALAPYTATSGPLLIVDDVFTTGGSMEEERAKHPETDVIGVVVFGRIDEPRPAWIKALWQQWGDYPKR